MNISLFNNVLGDSFLQLHPLLQQLHDGRKQRWSGTATVTWGKSWWVHGLLMLVGLPRPGDNILCDVDLEPTPEGERLRRNFAGQKFHSHFRLAKPDMIEAFGPMRLRIATSVSGDQLLQHCAASHVLGFRLPRQLGLRIRAREWCTEAGMHFDVSIGLGIGIQFLRYRGCLAPVQLGA